MAAMPTMTITVDGPCTCPRCAHCGGTLPAVPAWPYAWPQWIGVDPAYPFVPLHVYAAPASTSYTLTTTG